MRTIGVVTVGRSDYSFYLPILREMQREPGLAVHLIVSGAHLSPEFGLTVRMIEGDGFTVGSRVEMLLSSDSPEGIAKSMGVGLIGFAQAYAQIRADLLLVLGDRFEMHAAALAALPFTIPVAHIHGGETTEGVIDEQVRHAVTKLAHLHFTAAEPFRRRLVLMGEDPRRVFCTGAPGLDGIARAGRIPQRELLAALGLPPALGRFGLVTYHPVTLSPGTAGKDARELAAALDAVDGVFWVITLPNAEAERVPPVGLAARQQFRRRLLQFTIADER